MNIKSNDIPRLIETDSIDWSEIVFMIERKISGSELARYVKVTTQAVGSWRRGVQGPCLQTGMTLIFLVADLYLEKNLTEYKTPADYFDALSKVLPRKGFTPWYPSNNHRAFKPAFKKPLNPNIRSGNIKTKSKTTGTAECQLSLI